MSFVEEKRAGFEGIRDEGTGLQFGVQRANGSWCPFAIGNDVSVSVPAGEPVNFCVVVPNLSIPFEVTLGGEEVEEKNYDAPLPLRLDKGEGKPVELTFTEDSTITVVAYRLSAQQNDAPIMEGVFGGGAPDDFVRASPTPALEFTLNVEVQLPPANPRPSSGGQQRRRRRTK